MLKPLHRCLTYTVLFPFPRAPPLLNKSTAACRAYLPSHEAATRRRVGSIEGAGSADHAIRHDRRPEMAGRKRRYSHVCWSPRLSRGSREADRVRSLGSPSRLTWQEIDTDTFHPRAHGEKRAPSFPIIILARGFFFLNRHDGAARQLSHRSAAHVCPAAECLRVLFLFPSLARSVSLRSSPLPRRANASDERDARNRVSVERARR